MNYVRLKRGYMRINSCVAVGGESIPRIIPVLSTGNAIQNTQKNSIGTPYLKVIRMLFSYNNNNNIN